MLSYPTEILDDIAAHCLLFPHFFVVAFKASLLVIQKDESHRVL